MDNQVVAQLATNLIDASARNTASYISEKIKASKAKKEQELNMIKIERIYDYKNDNTYTILVDRLWARGISKDKVKINLWAKEIAPSTELRKWFNHDEEKFDEFSKKYIEELNNNDNAILFLENLLEHENITLLYSAKDKMHNNAVVLEKWIKDKIKNNK